MTHRPAPLRPHRRAASLTIFLVAVGLTIAGCGGSGGGSPAPEGSSTDSSNGADADAFRDCLADHGVDLPEGVELPQGGERGSRAGISGVDREKFQEARSACADLAPAGVGGGAGGEAMQAYLSCLRDHGVNVPEPTADQGPRPSIDRDDPAFASADETCKALLPATTTTTGK